MSESPQVRFQVPINGRGYTMVAMRGLMKDKREGLHSFGLAGYSVDGVHLARDRARLIEAANLLNKLIDSGMPWSALATCRHGGGTLGALIEAADNRLAEIVGAQ